MNNFLDNFVEKAFKTTQRKKKLPCIIFSPKIVSFSFSMKLVTVARVACTYLRSILRSFRNSDHYDAEEFDDAMGDICLADDIHRALVDDIP